MGEPGRCWEILVVVSALPLLPALKQQVKMAPLKALFTPWSSPSHFFCHVLLSHPPPLANERRICRLHVSRVTKKKFPSSPEAERTHSAGKFKVRIKICKTAQNLVQHLPFLPSCLDRPLWINGSARATSMGLSRGSPVAVEGQCPPARTENFVCGVLEPPVGPS